MEIKIPYDIVEEHDPTTGEYIKKEVEVPNGMLTCGKCGMSKTSSYEMQTRSADEPMTIFANCLCCGNRWRF
ncbi:MAG: transcription factor S [Rhodospirillaceae bacterium]|nr:transcription factor S [Rhodospirillaceae bacterium]